MGKVGMVGMAGMVGMVGMVGIVTIALGSHIISNNEGQSSIVHIY